MANRSTGDTSFQYEGRKIKLRLNMNALLNAEDETGVELGLLLPSQRLGYRAVLLRHAIIEAGEIEPTRDEAAWMLMAGDAAKAWSDVFAQLFPPAAEDEGNVKTA